MSDSRGDLFAAAVLYEKAVEAVKCQECPRLATARATGSMMVFCNGCAQEREAKGWHTEPLRKLDPVLVKAYETMVEWAKEPTSKT